ncbi:MAG: hypothetical protein ACXADS_08320, partial [Candidatus Thorarchaeota archaeon]
MDRPGRQVITMFLMVMVLPGFVLGAVLTGPILPAQIPSPVAVTVVGADRAPTVYTSLQLDYESVQVTTANSIAEAVVLPGTDVIVLLDEVMGPVDIAPLQSFVNGGGGLLILLGSLITSNGTGFQELGITQNNDIMESGNYSNVVTRMVGENHPTLGFDWSSAPPTEKMTVLSPLAEQSQVFLANDTGFGTWGAPILVHTPVGAGNILVYTPWLTTAASAENQQINYQLVLWPYFNYYVYTAVSSLGGETPFTYAEWAYSPVPKLEQQFIIGVIVAVLS